MKDGSKKIRGHIRLDYCVLITCPLVRVPPCSKIRTFPFFLLPTCILHSRLICCSAKEKEELRKIHTGEHQGELRRIPARVGKHRTTRGGAPCCSADSSTAEPRDTMGTLQSLGADPICNIVAFALGADIVALLATSRCAHKG